MVPAEVLLLRAIFTDVRTPEPPDITAATRQFRADLQGARNIAFVDETLPLVHIARPPLAANTAPESAPRPDIYMIVVESLRGRELHPDHSRPEEHPNLTALMRRGVTLPYFVSNGFPSSAGYFAMTCSGWPHPSRFVLSEFATHSFDCLPPRLHALGYETAYFTAGNPSIDNQLTWSNKLYDHVHPCEAHHDRRLVDDFATWLDARDSASPDAGPIFAWLATISTHHPFVVNDPEHPPVASADLGTRYRDALLYADAQVSRLVKVVEARALTRRRPALIIIIGDHAFPVDEDAPPELESQGCDRRVWTAAIILGPESLIGPPRELTFPASQVDVMPTLLALVGDTGPTAALGRDLLDGQVEGRSAVVVTEGGLRLDLGDTSLFTNLDGSLTWRQDRQHASDCTPGPTPPDAETRERADALITRVQYWSWLVENDLIWPRAPAKP